MFVALATGFYSSLIPPKVWEWLKGQASFQRYSHIALTGSGLAGSFLGLVTYLVLPRFLAVNFFVILVAVLLSVWIGDRAEKLLAKHDDSRIVIDEWIGCWIAMVGIPPLIGFPQRVGFEVVSAFVLFRIFDVWKGPWGKRLQNLRGGWGVVMDDVAAGLVANFCARILIMIAGVL
jgi:phosphatidylglycerophosphatase A